MSLGLAGVLADARALWRRERELLVPIAGMFFVVPMLGIVLLLAYNDFPGDTAPDRLREAVAAFYAANLLPILLANLTIEFGTFAVLNLMLQGGGRTLGAVLLLTLRRFLPWLGISIIGSLLFSIGSSLLLLPGLFALGRTWLAGPSYAARPEDGPIRAFQQGWRRSGGFGWVALLAAAAMAMIVAIVLVILSTALIGAIAMAVGEARLEIVALVFAALIGGGAWTALALIRVAAYRAGEPRQGM